MRNPYAGEVATVAAAAGRDVVRGAVEAAAGAFEAWAETPVSERRALLAGAAIGRVSELVQDALAHGAQLVAGAERALAVANDSDYGLSASIFSRDVQLARRIQSGMCQINAATVHDESHRRHSAVPWRPKSPPGCAGSR